MVIIPSKMGKHNKRALLDRLLRLGTASRADLAKSLGLSQPTTGKIADELIELGVFEETETNGCEKPAADVPHRRLGRPARMLRLTQSKARFLGFQLGLEKTTIAPLPLSMDDDGEWPVAFQTASSADEWFHGLRAAAAQISQKSFWGILVSVPGLVDERKGEILYSPNLHWTEKKTLPELIRKIWRGPIFVIQEERALALGHHAADPEGEDFFLVDFGEGVGGAVLISGKLYDHPLPVSGELGHTPVMGNERRCGCGSIGCLETIASTRGLLQSFALAHPKSPKTWNALSKSIAECGVEPWLAKTLDAMAAGIAGALNVFGLRRVVITGAVTELSPAVFSYLTAAIDKSALWARFGKLQVEKAPRRRKAGLVAAGIDRFIFPVEASDTDNRQI
jgi:predicted NBD/HSP70 family sugar kinase